jgi:transcriptional regulator NrdR family protein
MRTRTLCVGYRMLRAAMQKCPQCGFRKIQVQAIRHPDTGKLIRTQTVCTNCQSVIKTTKSKRWWRKA